ncbi:MAG: RNA polymerase sigma factor [Bacteroidetes bacterium]|nr:MAG: RNA polymerase sigma factor [Bacteroidota bacterium]
MLNEQELTARLQQGDQLAYKQLVDAWKDMVYNTALGLVQNEMDAEDLVQDVFVKAWESIGGFKGESKLSTWLYRITITKSLDLLRSRKRKKRFAFVNSIFGLNNELVINPPDFLHPGVKAENKERSVELFKAIDKLPQQQKVAFVLTRVEGLNHKAVSEILNTSIPAVESLLQRARVNLKKELEHFYRQHL